MSDISPKQAFIRAMAADGRVKWSRHALGKLGAETVTVRDVESALQQAQVIEDYPHLHRHLPDCLVLVLVSAGNPIHCVVALDEVTNFILVVTVYRPLEKEWNDDWRTRK